MGLGSIDRYCATRESIPIYRNKDRLNWLWFECVWSGFLIDMASRVQHQVYTIDGHEH